MEGRNDEKETLGLSVAGGRDKRQTGRNMVEKEEEKERKGKVQEENRDRRQYGKQEGGRKR